MTQPRNPRTAREPSGMTEPQALALLRQNVGVRWLSSLLTCLLVGGAMVPLRALVFDDPWGEALFYGAAFGLVMFVLQLVLEWRRARRMPEGAADWKSMEKATVVSRVGRDVTVRGRRHTVVVPVHSAWSINEGDALWVGPSVKEGQPLVLVRAVGGPLGSSVHASAGPAERV